MKLIAQLTAIVIAFGVAGFVHAAPADKEAKKAERAANRKAAKGDRVNGTITKIEGNSITVSSVGRKAAAGDVVVQLNNATAIKVNGQAGAVGDLKPGMRVQVAASGGVASEIRTGGGKNKDKANKPNANPNKANKKNKAK